MLNQLLLPNVKSAYGLFRSIVAFTYNIILEDRLIQFSLRSVEYNSLYKIDLVQFVCKGEQLTPYFCDWYNLVLYIIHNVYLIAINNILQKCHYSLFFDHKLPPQTKAAQFAWHLSYVCMKKDNKLSTISKIN